MSTPQRVDRALLIAVALCLLTYLVVFSLLVTDLRSDIGGLRDAKLSQSSADAALKPNEGLAGDIAAEVLRDWGESGVRTNDANLSLLQEYVARWDASSNKIGAVITYAVPWYSSKAGLMEFRHWRDLSRELSPEAYKAQLKDKMEDFYSRNRLGALDWLISVARGSYRHELRSLLDPIGTIAIIIGAILVVRSYPRTVNGSRLIGGFDQNGGGDDLLSRHQTAARTNAADRELAASAGGGGVSLKTIFWIMVVSYFAGVAVVMAVGPELWNFRAFILDPLGTIAVLLGVFLLVRWLFRKAKGKSPADMQG